MLFNSYVFLFAFLPLTLVGFWIASRSARSTLGVHWLNAVSLFFYAWWAPRYLGLLVGSVAFNFLLGRALERRTLGAPRARKRLLIAGIAGNLAALAYFKYANFFVASVAGMTGASFHLDPIVLPLGISFFTFTQIAYLVDTYERPQETGGTISEYLLFVCFFPHLLAGPIVHHGQLMPQMTTPAFRRLAGGNLVIGGSIFLMGLAKKVLGADTFAVLVGPIFGAAAEGPPPTLIEAWIGALAYTLQLYFDFSGYSDMAIGLARLFGIRFPRNFDSPYKATSIVDFWRRWHITLSAFLRDYLYIRLGGNRRGAARRYVNLFLTMLLGGLWHGAGWTFVLWGALHGAYLVVNHAVIGVRAMLGLGERASRPARLAAGALTFVAVVVGWVFFRAPTVGAAWSLLLGMTGRNGLVVSETFVSLLNKAAGFGDRLVQGGWQVGELRLAGLPLSRVIVQLAIGFGVVWLLPNSGEVFARHHGEGPTPSEASPPRFHEWRPSLAWGLAIGVLLALSLAAVAGRTEFIYFQF